MRQIAIKVPIRLVAGALWCVWGVGQDFLDFCQGSGSTFFIKTFYCKLCVLGQIRHGGTFV